MAYLLQVIESTRHYRLRSVPVCVELGLFWVDPVARKGADESVRQTQPSIKEGAHVRSTT